MFNCILCFNVFDMMSKLFASPGKTQHTSD